MKLTRKTACWLGLMVALVLMAGLLVPLLSAHAQKPRYVSWRHGKDKWVPIVSLDKGIRVGAAQVSGPAVQVDKTKAVAEVGLEFKNVGRIRAYVPISSMTKLERVQGVSVWATGDIGIVKF